VIEKLYTDKDLTIIKFRFWDLCIQKILRNFTSMKFIIFLLIFWATVLGLNNGLISDVVFGSVVTAGLVVIATSRVYTDTRLTYDDTKYEERGEDNGPIHNGYQDRRGRYNYSGPGDYGPDAESDPGREGLGEGEFESGLGSERIPEDEP
jgi:hypothetical protein